MNNSVIGGNRTSRSWIDRSRVIPEKFEDAGAPIFCIN
jgi:hypothetical protein